MTLRNRILSSRSFAVSLAIALGIIVVVMISFAVILARNTYLTMRLSTICPDFFQYEYAYVVDGQGKGIDSVAVELRDNSNFNKIYRTFTDSNGRFVLFHDFGSFALHNIPFSYYLLVSVGGWNDTIRYSFERYRVCHFRKTDGPDTIVCDFKKHSSLTLHLEHPETFTIDTGFGFEPFEEAALSDHPSEGTSKLPFEKAMYTTIPVGKATIPFAVISIRDYRIIQQNNAILTEGTYYVIDRDGDRDLGDEQPLLFSGPGESSDKIVDCTVRTCHTIDSIVINNTRYRIAFQLRGMNHTRPSVRFRRGDALKGSVTIDSATYTIFVWDRRALDYSDLSAVVLGIDRNGDGMFDRQEGSGELYEQVLGQIVFDSLSLCIDTITPDGRYLACSDIRRDGTQSFTATTGSWIGDFTAAVATPLSLYQECDAHRYVVLYFFEGTAANYMDASDIRTLITLMRDHLGPTRCIGINRHVTGEPYTREPVINENKGWRGPLVRQFHNHRAREIVCMDSAATIVYRGPVTTAAITALWHHAAVDDAVAISFYEYNNTSMTIERPQE